ncbi:MAG TPA: hypothetical protein VFJ17_05290 [Mycobacteriales bacterium]|jgi:hypothetical protein|nr:hypothetical protein [Mycobacteriales bacterium]
MRRPVTAITVALAVASTATAMSASAATKPKTHVMKGQYNVTALPDPTVEATDQTGTSCANINPAAVDLHDLNLPAKGLLHVVLDGTDPTGALDWDLYLLDAKGNEIGGSNGATSHEELFIPHLGKGKVTIKACNLAGAPTATVNYQFTYKK